MELLEAIRKRESLRSYDIQRKVSRETLLRILEAGRLAPSACNLQPWKILVVESEPLLSEIKSTYKRDWLKGAPHIIAVTGSVKNCWQRKSDGYISIETDLTIVMDHIILAAASEGVGTCWVANFDPAALKETLKLPEDEKIFAFTPIGYPPKDYSPANPKVRKSLDEIVRFI